MAFAYKKEHGGNNSFLLRLPCSHLRGRYFSVKPHSGREISSADKFYHVQGAISTPFYATFLETYIAYFLLFHRIFGYIISIALTGGKPHCKAQTGSFTRNPLIFYNTPTTPWIGMRGARRHLQRQRRN